jgi:hypothetical protein
MIITQNVSDNHIIFLFIESSKRSSFLYFYLSNIIMYISTSIYIHEILVFKTYFVLILCAYTFIIPSNNVLYIFLVYLISYLKYRNKNK